jgi:hypothetical protein
MNLRPFWKEPVNKSVAQALPKEEKGDANNLKASGSNPVAH